MNKLRVADTFCNLADKMGHNPFFLDVFIISFRESLEASVIVSVLLSFVKQSFGQTKEISHNNKAYRRLLWHVWLGVIIGFFVCLCVGAGFIGAFYTLGTDIWSKKEDLWEGILAVIASVMITAMGLGMLRIEKMKAKWRVKIAEVILEGGLDDPKYKGKLGWVKRWNPKNFNPMKFRPSTLGRFTRKYSMLLLTFVTVMREGVEAIVFIAGVSLGHPAYSYPLSVFLGLVCGCGVGYILYVFGSKMSLRWFLVGSTCFLYLIAAGLFSRSVWYLQMYKFSQQTGGDVAENGSGPGSYNIKQTVWHVNCCNPELNNNGWGIFNALFGWQNTGTYGSVISYNCYWIAIMVMITCLIYEERTGKLPIIGMFWKRKSISQEEADEMFARAQAVARKNALEENGDVETNEGMCAVEKLSSNTKSESSDNHNIKKEAVTRTVEV